MLRDEESYSDLLLLQEEKWQAAQERLVALAKANSEAQACPCTVNMFFIYNNPF